GHAARARARAQARQPGTARSRRQRDHECLPRARHRRQRFRGDVPGLSSPGRTSDMSNMYRTNIAEVPKVEGLKRKDGWIDMQVQFLIDKRSAGADHVVGWSVLKPGASHERHLHRNCDEFFIVLKGKGSSPIKAWSRRRKATWSIRRAARGTASTTRQMRTWCSSGAGWGQARSKRPATRCRGRATGERVFAGSPYRRRDAGTARLARAVSP